MAKNIKNFVNREFAKTVDLDLLKRLLDPFTAKIAFDWNALPEGEKDKREAIFEFFRSADERLPAELLDALHKIMVLSDANGARLLQEQAELAGVSLVPKDEIEGENDGRHLTPRHLALRAYLDHRVVFERALDIHAFWAVRSPLELSGDREGVESQHEDKNARAAFAAAASAYFASRYLGRYCDVRWYPEGDEINILVLHGKNVVTANVEENGAERTLTYREIAQDTIRYDVSSVDEGEHEVDGRTRYSPWAMTVRDSRNALTRLAELAPDVDFQDLRINYVKLEFHFKVEGKDTRILVKVKPSNVASFRDHSFEDRIMEHLERNGIRIARSSMPTAAAAE